jgi:branched-chain amino acid transport system substrate-binding protein
VKDAKIGVLMQNDDYGKDYYEGLRDGLGKEVKRIVKHATFETTDPTVDSQIIQLKDSGANAFFNIATPKFAAQAIRKIADLGWKPVHYLNNVSASVSAVLKPAGFDNCQGIITVQYLKDPNDKQWADDSEMKAWRAWMAKYNPDGNAGDAFNIFAYAVAATLHKTLEKCGNDLTRANIMKQAASLKKLAIPLLLPGITVNTSPTDFYPIQSVRLQRFTGESWELFGDIMASESA